MKTWIKEKYGYIIVVILVLGVILADVFVAKKAIEREIKSRTDIQIKQSNSGYDIYKNNELMLEFTKQNCDSMSLETLKYIYDVSKEK